MRAAVAFAAATLLSQGCSQRSDGASILDRLDDAVAAGDLATYEALTRPLHRRVHEQRLRWLESAVGEGSWRVDSTVLDSVEGPDCSIVLLSTAFRAPGVPEDAEECFRTRRYVAHAGEGADARVLLDIDVFTGELGDHPLSETKGSLLGCRACNYVIEVFDGWLPVPHPPQRAGVLEAVSLYSLRHSASVDLSIHVSRSGPTPEKLLAELVAQRADAATRAAHISKWLPPSYREKTIAGLSGAMVDLGAVDGWATRLHAVRFGPIVYVLTLEGTEHDLRGQRDEIESVLAGFMLRETDPEAVSASVRPVEQHSGGRLDGGVYVNETLGISLRGPEDFCGVLRCGPHLCHVAFTCPEGHARLTLRVLQPPFGRPRWTTGAVDWTLDRGVEGLATDSDSGWQTDADGEQVRELRVHDDEHARAVRAIVPESGDQLYVLDARAPTAEALARLVRHFDSFER